MSGAVSIPTLNHLFFHVLDRGEPSKLLRWNDANGRTVEYSTASFGRAAFALCRYLRTCGLAPGDRVAILSENRPEWHVADFAILLARMVVVPVYPALSAAQARFLLEHSGCRAAIVGGRDQWEALGALRPVLPELRWTVGMDDSVEAPVILSHLAANSPEAGFSNAERAACLEVDPQSVATIVYTSGTTARPKGVMLSHANLTFDLQRCLERVAFQAVGQVLSVLPLPHVFERILCYGYFRMGASIAYGNPHDLKQLLTLYRPEVMGCVPRVLEKIHEAVDAQLSALPPSIGRLARGLFKAATLDARARSAGRPIGARLRLAALVARLLAAPRVSRRLGGIENFVCGGAWLNPEIELFFRALGFVVLQGYGMTETSPVIALSAPGAERLGSVGRVLEGVEVRLTGQGEILTRGANVMLGYYRDQAASAEVLQNGWLATGDLGRIDADGYLFITGRAKEMMVLSSGKKVFCPVLEQAVERSPYVRKAFLVGQGRKFVAALLVPHLENLGRKALENKLSFSSPGQLLALPQISDLLRRDVDAQQAEFSSFERIKRFGFVTEEELSDPELMTPTQKVRRDRLEAKFADRIERIYSEASESPPDPRAEIQAGHVIEEIHG
jgi:long-chain acyl-CoA synthetase